MLFSICYTIDIVRYIAYSIWFRATYSALS